MAVGTSTANPVMIKAPPEADAGADLAIPAQKPRQELLRAEDLTVILARLAASIMIAVAVVPGALAAEGGCHLRVGWEPYAPYTYSTPSGEVTGADIELIKTIASELDCALQFAELPWARILREIEGGTLDVSTSTSLTEERTAWALFSQPYRTTEMAVFVRADDAHEIHLMRLADIDDRKFRLGVITEYYYGEEFDQLQRDKRHARWIDGATDYQTNIRKLIGGRIDGFLVEDVNVMSAELARLELSDEVTRLPLRLGGEDLRFMFSRKTVDQDLVDKVDAVISRLRDEGRLDMIFAEYVP